jgi:hypothetical protein
MIFTGLPADTEISVLSKLINIALPECFKQLGLLRPCVGVEIGFVDKVM